MATTTTPAQTERLALPVLPLREAVLFPGVEDYGIATRVAQPKEGLPPLPQPQDARLPALPLPVQPASPTVIYGPSEPAALEPEPEPEPEPVPEPEPEPEIVTLTVNGRIYPITSQRLLIGRSRECDIRLADQNVSRRHAEVRREDAIPLLLGDLGPRPKRVDRRVVDEDVEPTERRRRHSDGLCPVGRGRDVETGVDDGRAEVVGDDLSLIVEDVADHDGAAFACQHSNYLFALSTCASGDDRNFSFKAVPHDSPISVVLVLQLSSARRMAAV